MWIFENQCTTCEPSYCPGIVDAKLTSKYLLSFKCLICFSLCFVCESRKLNLTVTWILFYQQSKKNICSIRTFWQICLQKKRKHYHLWGHTSSIINHCSMIIVRILVNTMLLITWFVPRVTRRLPHINLEILTFPEYLSSHQVFSGFHVTRSLLVLCSVS